MTQSRDLTPREAKLEAELRAEVGWEQVGDVYARALLAAADKAGQLAAIVDEFDSFLADVLDRFPRLESVIGSGLVSAEDSARLLQQSLAGQASTLFLNFLLVVARHGRLNAVRAIHRQTHVRYDEMCKRVHVDLVTAAPVDQALVDRVTESLRGKLRGEPVVRCKLEPGLIGGAVLRIGDVVYDGSIATQLANLRQQMIDRSVHEIQSRRDRLGNPAGN